EPTAFSPFHRLADRSSQIPEVQRARAELFGRLARDATRRLENERSAGPERPLVVGGKERAGEKPRNKRKPVARRGAKRCGEPRHFGRPRASPLRREQRLCDPSHPLAYPLCLIPDL